MSRLRWAVLPLVTIAFVLTTAASAQKCDVQIINKCPSESLPDPSSGDLSFGTSPPERSSAAEERTPPASIESEPRAVSAPASSVAGVTVIVQVEAADLPSVPDPTYSTEHSPALVLSASQIHTSLKPIAAGAWLLVASCLLMWKRRLYVREVAALRKRVGALIDHIHE